MVAASVGEEASIMARMLAWGFGPAAAICADAADYLIEIEVAGRRRLPFHACHTFGRPGQVAGVFWQATSE